jgi:pimeloyl-ACP methyl ester carboxylesterase
MTTALRVTGADGVALSVRTTGNRHLPALVCVHGYPDDSALWDGVAAELRDRFQVVAYDVRGAGNSAKPRRRRAYRLDVLERDFAAVVDAVSPHRPVHVLAHDWGSIQAWHFVTGERLAGRIASFTSISGPCLDHAAYRMRSRPIRPGLGQFVKSWYIMLFQLPLLPELFMHSVGRLAIAAFRRAGPRSTLPSSTSVADYVRGIQLYRANMLPRLLRPQARRTTVPVQVIAPTRDLFVSPTLQREVERWAPNLRTHTVQGGHWLPRTHSGEIAALVAGHADRSDLAEPEPRLA